MNKIILFTLLLFFQFNLFGNDLSLEKDSLLYKNLIEEANDNFWNTDNDLAVENFEDAIEMSKRNGWKVREIKTLINLATLKIYRNQIEEAEKLLQKIEDKIDGEFKEEKELLLEIEIEYNEAIISYIYSSGGDLNIVINKANFIIKKLEVVKDRNEDQLNALYRNYYYLSEAYNNLGHFQQAIDYAKKAVEIQDNPYSLVMLGNLYFRIQDYSTSKQIYYELIERLEKDSPDNGGYAYFHGHLGLAKNYFQENDFKNALKYARQSLRFESPNSSNTAIAYNLFGEIFLKQNSHKEAKKYFEKALKLDKVNFDISKQGFHFYHYYLNIGDALLLQKDFKTSFQQYQKAFRLLNSNFEFQDFINNPSPNFLEFPLDNLKVFDRKIKAIRKQFEQNNESEKTATWGLRTCEDAMDWMDKIFKNYTSDNDQQLFIDQSYSIIENAIFFALKLDQKSLAFEYSEKSRSIVLNQALKRKAWKKFNNDKNPLAKKINALKSKKYIAENKKNDPTYFERKDSLRKVIVDLNEKIAILEDSLINTYPPALKNSLKNNDVIALEVISKNLSPNQVLVEFFVGETDIFAFLIDKKGLKKIEMIPFSKSLKIAINNISDYLYYKKNDKYFESGHLIFSQLFEPLFAGHLPKRLIIVPDGNLGYVPFNILLTEKVAPSSNIPSKKSPYFFRQSSISLAFSASKQFGKYQPLQNPTYEKILAYAPAFKKLNNLSKEEERNQNIEEERGALDSLENVFNEVENLGKKYSADIIFSEAATKEHFLKNAKDYSILHLATHAKVNKYESDLSFVAFTNLNKNYQNLPDHLFKLSLGEIYVQEFTAQMVVLSACETGIGKPMKGEGIISIARGFAYAGIPSIVTSLWRINDRTTAKLMESFYKNLATGMEKDLALNQAIKDYLDDEETSLDDSHPKKWAAFTVIDNLENISIKQKSTRWYYLGIGFVAILFLFFLFRKKSD